MHEPWLCSSGRALRLNKALRGMHVLALLLCLLLCTHSWGACTARNFDVRCSYPSYNCGGADFANYCNLSALPELETGCVITAGPEKFCYTSSSMYARWRGYCCANQCEADSAAAGGIILECQYDAVEQKWYKYTCTGGTSCAAGYCQKDYYTDESLCLAKYCEDYPSAPGCDEPVPENCQEDYSQCMSMGGVWKKIGSTPEGCQSECDLCGSKGKTNVMNAIANVCCKQGLAPPDSAVQCFMPASSGVGMTSSVMNDKNNTYQCGQLTTSDGGAILENQALYKRFCIDGDQYEEQADTNDIGSSSSGEGDLSSSSMDEPTSFGTELDALGGIYGVLDTIRDTLILSLNPSVREIRDCLYSFKLCAQLDSLYVDWSAMPKDSTWFYIDTGLVKYIRPFMDASVALDSNQLKALRHLDTNILKQLHLDSVSLKNDSVTRRSIVGGLNEVDSSVSKNTRAVRGVDSSVVRLDTSFRKGIQEGTDKIIDSMDFYLGRVDTSIRGIGGDGTPLGDSLGKLIGILGGSDTGSVGSGQYGDSASAYGDSIRKWIRDGDRQWDSAFGATEGEWGVDSLDDLYDSSFSYGMCHGDDCPPCTDSDCLGKITPGILKYGDSIAAQLGDSLIKNVQAQEDSLPSMWDSAFVKLREVSFFSTFDSTFLAKVGAMIPNTNTCPEDCFRHSVNGRYAYVAYNMTLDWKLCSPIAPGVLNGLNAFDILKLLARVLTVVTCLSILMWEVSSRRGGGMGL